MNIVFEMNPALADVRPVTHYVQESSSRKFQYGRKSLAGKTRKRTATNPKPQKTPKSSYPQKQHNTAIKLPLFLGSFPLKFQFRSGPQIFYAAAQTYFPDIPL